MDTLLSAQLSHARSSVPGYFLPSGSSTLVDPIRSVSLMISWNHYAHSSIDEPAGSHCGAKQNSINQQKPKLLDVLVEEVMFEEQTGPLLVVITRYVAGFVRALNGESKGLSYPQSVGETNT